MIADTFCDRDEISRALRVLCEPGEDSIAELRCPRTPNGVVSGYFDELAPMVKAAVALSGRAEAVYVTLNPVLPDLLARAYNRARTYAKDTTQDKHVLRRRWLLVDFDPRRPAGISSTDEEHEAALERARDCRDWLLGRGFPAPVYADSGNGAHLLYRVDYPNDPAHEEFFKGGLAVLAARFNDERVTVDRSTFNASRISKVYGTLAAKGDSVPRLGRVHRLARLLDVPDRLEVVRFDGGAA